MNKLIIFGAASLGTVIGWLVHQTFVRLKELNARALASIVSVMVGAGVIGLLQKFAGEKSAFPVEAWTYPIGLLLGLIVSAGLENLAKEDLERKKRKAEAEQLCDERISQAHKMISNYFKNNSVSRMSYDAMRATFHYPEWTDEFFRNLVEHFPDEFEFAKIRGGLFGLRLTSATRITMKSNVNEIIEKAEQGIRNQYARQTAELKAEQTAVSQGQTYKPALEGDELRDLPSFLEELWNVLIDAGNGRPNISAAYNSELIREAVLLCDSNESSVLWRDEEHPKSDEWWHQFKEFAAAIRNERQRRAA